MLWGREEWFGYTPSGLSTKQFHKRIVRCSKRLRSNTYPSVRLFKTVS
jgi:hypothetical protein